MPLFGMSRYVPKKRLRGRLMPKGPKIFLGVRFVQWRKHLPSTDITRVHLSQPRGFTWVKFVFSSRPCSERFFSGQWRIQGRGPGPPSFLDQTETRRAEKNFLGRPPFPPSKGLDDRATHYLEVKILIWWVMPTIKSSFTYLLKEKRDKWTKTPKASYLRSWKEFFL